MPKIIVTRSEVLVPKEMPRDQASLCKISKPYCRFGLKDIAKIKVFPLNSAAASNIQFMTIALWIFIPAS